MEQGSRRSPRSLTPKANSPKMPASPMVTKKTKLQASEESHPVEQLQDLANLMRIDCVEITSKCNSGHPTSSTSCADIILFFGLNGMKYFAKDPANKLNDRLVLSKGHAAPILYSAWHRAGYFTKDQIMTLRSVNSNIEGHPTPDHPFVDVATGSLGQGLGVAAGMAYSSKNFDSIDNHYFCIMGDAETQEGSVWEAAMFASQYHLNNLTAIVDCNQFGQSNTLGHDQTVLDVYKKKFEAFGWNAIVIDGHNMLDIIASLDKARSSTLPFAIIAKTFKGRNCGPDVENNKSYHGKPLGDKSESAKQHLLSLIKNQQVILRNQEPQIAHNGSKINDIQNTHKQNLSFPFTVYDPTKLYATREGYGNALKTLGSEDNQVIGLDADLKNSTFADRLFNAKKEKFIECYICEQNMISVASGVAARGKIPFCSTFACFLSRGYDQIRMAGISKLNIKFCGSHCGVSIGEDGSSQMGLEDISMFRAIPNSVVLYPSDAISTERCVQLAANRQGIVYIRTGRNPGAILYNPDTQFEIGKIQVLKQSQQDQFLIVAGGITVNEALKAYETLKSQNIFVKVVDIFSVKPVDKEGLLNQVKQSKNRMIVVEDHYEQGGIYSAVCEAIGKETDVVVHSMAVQEVPKSGKPLELLEKFGISGSHITKKVLSLIQ